jgi:hypothetical protein
MIFVGLAVSAFLLSTCLVTMTPAISRAQTGNTHGSGMNEGSGSEGGVSGTFDKKKDTAPSDGAYSGTRVMPEKKPAPAYQSEPTTMPEKKATTHKKKATKSTKSKKQSKKSTGSQTGTMPSGQQNMNQPMNQ